MLPAPPTRTPKGSREVCLSLSSLCFQKYAITSQQLSFTSTRPQFNNSTYFERGLIKYEIKGHLGGFSRQNKCGQKRRLFSKKAPVPCSLRKELSPSNAQLCSQKQQGEEKQLVEVWMFKELEMAKEIGAGARISETGKQFLPRR